MKRCFAFFLLIGVLAIITQPYVFADEAVYVTPEVEFAQSELSLPVNENYDNVGKSSSLESLGWKAGGSASMQIASDPKNKENNCFSFVPTKNALGEVKRDFDPMSGSVIIEFMINVSDVSYKQIPSIFGESEIDGSAVEVVSVSTFSINSNILVNDVTTGEFMEPGRWYKYTLIIDTDKDTLKFLIDGKLFAFERALSSKINNISYVRFRTTSRGLPIYIDDLKIGYGKLDIENWDYQFKNISNYELKKHPLRTEVEYEIPIYKNDQLHTVDGVLNEEVWLYSKKYKLGKKTVGETNANVQMSAFWDEEYLHIGVIAYDDNLVKDSGIDTWKDDSIEIYLDGGNEKTTTYDDNDRQLTIGWNTDAITGANASTKTYSTGVKFAQADIDGGWSLEASIPWDSVGVTAKEGIMMGFDVGYNDDNNGDAREGQIMWAGSSQNSKNTFGFGTIVLNNDSTSDHRYTHEDIIKSSMIFKIDSPKFISKGKVVAFDEETMSIMPKILDGKTYVPLRRFAESMGLEVQWDEQSSSIELFGTALTVDFSLNNNTIEVKGTVINDNHNIKSIDSLSYIPITVMGKLLGKQVYYNEDGWVVFGDATVSTIELFANKLYAELEMLLH